MELIQRWPRPYSLASPRHVGKSATVRQFYLVQDSKTMKRIVPACLLVAALIVVGVRAEIAPQTPDELEKKATHIVVGTVRFIGAAEKRDKEWLRTGGVVEIKVNEVKKGKRIEAGDCVYPRFWQTAWIGKGDPPPYGSGHHLPKVGDSVRVFLNASDGGYDVLLPNGIEVVTKTATDVAPATLPASQEPGAAR
jgi:hypothetical protein